MKKALLLILTLSLLLPSPAFPEAETAQVPVSRYLAGSWAGNINGLCGQLTIGTDGTFTRFVFEDDSLSSSGTVRAENPSVLLFTDNESGVSERYNYLINTEQLLLTNGGISIRFRRLKEKLLRAEQPDETVIPSADPALAGTWGSMDDGYYSEWTFTGNGECRKFVPFDNNRSISGIYAAGFGTLAILAKEDTLIVNYETDGHYMTLSFPGRTPVHFIRKTGPLVPQGKAP